MSHFEEPKLSDDEEPPTEQDKRKKLVSQIQHSHTHSIVTTKNLFSLNFHFHCSNIMLSAPFLMNSISLPSDHKSSPLPLKP